MGSTIVSIPLKWGRFILTKWLSDSMEVVEHIPLEECSSCFEGRLLADDTCSHILGILWAVASDKLSISADYLTSAPTTRRQLLSAISSIFDPLGLVAPALLAPKVLLQKLVKKDLSWDDFISSDQIKVLQSWARELPLLSTISVSRCFRPSGFGHLVKLQLHHFSDASQKAYSACSYL